MRAPQDWVFYNGFKARKLHGGYMTEPISMNTGVCPVCLLQKLEDLDFADDLALLSQGVTHMQQKLEFLQEQVARVGLKVNAANTKEMRIQPTSKTVNISCAGDILEQVAVFTYLGSLIITTVEDVETRCRQAAFFIVRPNYMEIKVYHSTDKDKDLQFQHEALKICFMELRPGDKQRRSSPFARPYPTISSSTSKGCGGQVRSPMMSCGSVKQKINTV